MSLFSTLKRGLSRGAPAIELELDDIQATLLRERPEPYFGTHFLVRVDEAEGGRALLGRLRPHVASAAESSDATRAWVAVAISYAGLAALGVPKASLESFPEAFRQGMAARADRLGDHGPNAPERWEAPYGRGQIHLALSVFAGDEAEWRRAAGLVRAIVQASPGVDQLGSHDFGAQPGGRNPFGYKDLISNPAVGGSGVEPLPGQGPPIAPGEFVLGYPGASGAPLAMPAPDVLGRNGTFVVLRKYQSRVGAFNRFLRAQADTPEGRELLAAKLVGRWRSGAPLALAPERDDPALGADPRRNNAFSYAEDPAGKQVPLGAHMRRMNPRDGKLAVLTDVNVHRILRRSTTFGPAYDPDEVSTQADSDERGIFFIFLSARAPTTIEFLQQEWVNRGNFVELGEERDPILGLHEKGGTFTVPQAPVRKRCHGLETFNVLRGGEYLFLPSLSALQWLERPVASEM